MSLLVDSIGLPSGSGNSGKPPLLSSAKSIHALHPRRIHRQRRRVLALANTEIVEAARVGQRQGRYRLPLNAEYIPLASSIVVPINVASPWT